jgi:peroxiredoxin
MKKLLLALFLISSFSLFAQVENGDAAPGFTLTDVDGNAVSLSDFKGKTVVLEWINPGCPFVRKFYTNGDMGKFQKKAAEMGVVWLAINSTSNSHGDFLTPSASKSWAGEHGFAATWLMDSNGAVGKAYGARTTPHMFIINGDGKVVYQGAIDSMRDADPASVSLATNYVMDALKALDAGKEIAETQTRPYGCSVKY